MGRDDTRIQDPWTPRPRVIQVTVDSSGFVPSEIRVKKGENVKLVFTRTVDRTYATAVVVKDLGVNPALTGRRAGGGGDQAGKGRGDSLLLLAGLDQWHDRHRPMSGRGAPSPPRRLVIQTVQGQGGSGTPCTSRRRRQNTRLRLATATEGAVGRFASEATGLSLHPKTPLAPSALPTWTATTRPLPSTA